MYSITVPFFDINKTYDTFQSCLWRKVCDNKYIIFHKNESTLVSQTNDRLLFSCTKEKFYDVWWEYLDLKTDYEFLYYQFIKVDKKLKPLIQRSKGVHLIKKEPWETLLDSIFGDDLFDRKYWFKNLTEICNTEKIKKNIQGLGKITFNTIPTPEQIIKNKDNLSKTNLTKILLYVSECVLENEMFLNELYNLEYEQIKERLKKYKFPQLVIDKLCLHCYGIKSVFPKNKIINEFLDKVDLTKSDFTNNYLKENGIIFDNKGIINQYFSIKYYKDRM